MCSLPYIVSKMSYSRLLESGPKEGPHVACGWLVSSGHFYKTPLFSVPPPHPFVEETGWLVPLIFFFRPPYCQPMGCHHLGVCHIFCWTYSYMLRGSWSDYFLIICSGISECSWFLLLSLYLATLPNCLNNFNNVFVYSFGFSACTTVWSGCFPSTLDPFSFFYIWLLWLGDLMTGKSVEGV